MVITIFTKTIGYKTSAEKRLWEDIMEAFFKLVNVHKITYSLILYSEINERFDKSNARAKAEVKNLDTAIKYNRFFDKEVSYWHLESKES